MRKSILILFLLLMACTAPGGLKPSVVTMPPSYLDSFPLGTMTESEMISKLGPPDKVIEFGGKNAFVYQLGKGQGVRTYTYTFDGGVVVDVLYNDNGPYNGFTAKSRQGK